MTESIIENEYPHIIERWLHDGAENNNPNMIVVHSMAEYILDPDPIFAPDFLEKLGYSAHALILPNCDVMICRRPEQGAYHARGFNTDSLGIEFLVEGAHTYGTFLDAIKQPWLAHGQYEAGLGLIRHWQSLYNIKKDRIVRHSDISPGRKLDPGKGFPWKKLQYEVE